MTKSKSYKTGESLRTALNDRLKVEAKKQDVELNRLTRQVAYDRLLARIFSETDAPFLLKGGYATQLRVAQARGTKDSGTSRTATSNPTARVSFSIQR